MPWWTDCDDAGKPIRMYWSPDDVSRERTPHKDDRKCTECGWPSGWHLKECSQSTVATSKP